jgi:hypothetical protein
LDKASSNRKNAQQSTGPHDTTSTRFNAVKHGLLARGMTELDDSDEYQALIQRLREAYPPAGDLEEFFIQRIAFHMIRLHRTEGLESEFITSELHPSVVAPSMFGDMTGPVVVTEGVPPAVGAAGALSLAAGFQRYETAIENKLYRAINQLERLQRARRGEFVPAPQTVDFSINPRSEREA